MENFNPNGNFQFTEDEFNNAKSRDKLPIQCLSCGKTFYVVKSYIQAQLKRRPTVNRYCSLTCYGAPHKLPPYELKCTNCGTPISIEQRLFKKSKTGNFFCSKSCSLYYNNTNKTTGYNRSKLELFLEEELSKMFPELDIIYNDRKVCGGLELDIYIPSLNIAFELNGPVHYQPVFGKTEGKKIKKFETVKNHDLQKQIICQEKGIGLYIVDVSKHRYKTKEGNAYYLELVKDCIIESM